MAIKGKGRTRGRRTVAAPPRRQLVIRKPPLWRRPWVWAIVGLLVVGGIVWGILIAVGNSAERARTERETAAVQRFVDRIQEEFPDDVMNVPPDLVVAFPQVAQDLPQIGKEVTPSQARRRGRAVAEAASSAADGINVIAVSQSIPAEFPGVRAAFEDAKFLLLQSFRTYERIGALMEMAADLRGDQRQALVEQAQELVTQAGALFDQGYREIVRVATRLRVPTAVSSPPTTPPPTAEPSPSPTSEPSPSPSP
jgi:hypothetical protein